AGGETRRKKKVRKKEKREPLANRKWILRTTDINPLNSLTLTLSLSSLSLSSSLSFFPFPGPISHFFFSLFIRFVVFFFL
ncbi:hypothetical protein ASPTUDRAFT_172851, partial [Aspergillus tubingensis CBS 134.48]